MTPSANKPPTDSDRLRRMEILNATAVAFGIVMALAGLLPIPWPAKLAAAILGTVVLLRSAIPELYGPLTQLMKAILLYVGAAALLVGDAARSDLLPVTGVIALLDNDWQQENGLELVAPLAHGGLVNCSSGSEPDAARWNLPYVFGRRYQQFDAVTLIQSDFAAPGNLEVIGLHNGRLLLYWRESWRPAAERWNGPQEVAVQDVPVTGVVGQPALAQLRPGPDGDFILAVARKGAGVAIYQRHHRSKLPLLWSGPQILGLGQRFEAVALTRSGSDRLELVAKARGGMLFSANYSRGAWSHLAPVRIDGRPVLAWNGNVAVAYGPHGLELAVAYERGLALYRRQNTRSGSSWRGPTLLVAHMGSLQAVAMAYANSARLEVVARQGHTLYRLWREADAGPDMGPHVWHGLRQFTCDDGRQPRRSTRAP